MKEFIIVHFYTIVCLTVNVLIDHYAWKKALSGSPLDHNPRWIVRTLLFAPIIYVHWSLAGVGFMFFYLWFDPLLSLSMKRDFFYLGSSAIWDSFSKKKPIRRFFIELVLYLLCITFYFLR